MTRRALIRLASGTRPSATLSPIRFKKIFQQPLEGGFVMVVVCFPLAEIWDEILPNLSRGIPASVRIEALATTLIRPAFRERGFRQSRSPRPGRALSTGSSGVRRRSPQLVVTKRRDLGLRHSQHLGGVNLRELARFKDLIQRIGQAQLRLTRAGIGKPRSANTFPVPRVTGSLRSAFRLAIVLLVIPRSGPTNLRNAEGISRVFLDRRGKAQEVALGGPDPMQRLLVCSQDTSHHSVIPVLG